MPNPAFGCDQSFLLVRKYSKHSRALLDGIHSIDRDLILYRRTCRYYVVSSWLNNFANRIPLQWWLFLLPGMMVLVIAMLVVGVKSLRAANANPIDKLKYE